MLELDPEQLDAGWRDLVRAAGQARGNAYCPYSNYRVGAALLCAGGEVVTGANVENAAYGSTICAERAALVAANARGLREFERLVVSVEGKPAAPCGACRQMLHEFATIRGSALEVLLHGQGAEVLHLTSVEELLPYGFGLG